MSFTSQICTTEEQSERLLTLGLKKETADMSYFHTVGFEGNDLWLPSLSPYENIVKAPNYGEKTKIYIKSHTIPAWSLHRLIEMMPDEIFYEDSTLILGVFGDGVYYADNEYGEVFKSFDGNLYNCIIKCIDWLIAEGYFNKKYLED